MNRSGLLSALGTPVVARATDGRHRPVRVLSDLEGVFCLELAPGDYVLRITTDRGVITVTDLLLE